MRNGFIVAAALIAMPFAGVSFAATSATSAQAQEYCGFLPRLGAMVQCGYSNLQSCENAVGKGAMCFVNPYLALNEKRATPTFRHSEG
jgi:Protein of unknown function (DUF3551)